MADLGAEAQSSASAGEVLIVDDDAACVEEYAELVVSLGYACRIATDVPTALRILAENPAIGIVVTDLHMPMMDGMTFLDELSSRFFAIRPIVAIVVTGHGSLDVAVQAMRFNASDFLAKPVSRGDLSTALRRASHRLTQLRTQFRLLAMMRAEAAGNRPAATTPAASDAPVDSPAAAPNDSGADKLLGLVRSIVRQRERRLDYLDPAVLSDPVWDILLDLTSARLNRQQVTITSVCAAAHIPLTTGMRYIQVLVDNGLVRRWKDPQDQRRNLLELEEAGMEAMVAYLSDIGPRPIPS
ncbi:MAG: response regulator [Sphingomonadales bacterium]|nr:response regulator [Sphingomonadales bacterium]